MTSPTFLWTIVLGTVVTGCLNSIFTKYQDKQCVRDCNTSHPKTFEQPVLQTLQMFVGELCIYMAYWYSYKSPRALRRSEYSRIEPGSPLEPIAHDTISFRQSFVLSAPAICDLLGTTLINIGLLYTPVSIYQMTRGSVVLFVAIFSVVFLKRRITKLEWISLIIVTLGVVIVGLSGTSGSSSNTQENSNTSLVVFGMSLIVLAEVCQAIQFVIEEHLMANYPVIPLQLVYYEGFYGSATILIFFSLMHLIMGAILPSQSFQSSPFNMAQSFSEMFSNGKVLASSVAIMISISLFNYFGITITHQLSATSRSTVDTCRTLLVWIFAIVLGWETFSWLQFAGFIVLVYGTLCFNGVLNPENWGLTPSFLKEKREPLFLNDDPFERT